ncbi:MAG: FtsX-like permease family protein, partial [Cyclobacteriaceae bacterium]
DISSDLNRWRKNLRKHRFLEEGTIAELENHLLDEVESLERQGYSSHEAFNLAKKRLGDVSSVEQDELKVNSRGAGLLLPGLIRSFVRTGGRYLGKNLLTTTVNLGGLIVAFTAILLIGLFLQDELSFEKHHPDYESIYRLSYSFRGEDGSVEDRAYASGMWSELLESRSSSVSDQFRFLTLSYGYIFNPATNQAFYEEGVYWSDPNFFKFLNFKLKFGEVDNQLKNLNSIVLTEKTAKKIFGEENPIGKPVQFRRTSREVNFIVTGVIYDPPSNSHFQPDYIANIQSIQGIFGEDRIGWIDQNPRPGYVFNYIKIDRPEDVPLVHAEMKTLFSEILPDLSVQIDPLLTPISSIHFNPAIKWEIDTPINMSYIYGLEIIGIFILAVALVNYSSLTTAQGSRRRKEIGLRKTLGSTKTQLRIQFFLESISSVVMALILAVTLVFFLTPSFNSLVGKNIDFESAILSTNFLSIAVPVVLMVLLLAGMLPALYFTKQISNSFNLTHFFKSNNTTSRNRNAMVLIQFTIAIILVIGSVTVYNQLELINNGGLGKSRKSVIGIRTSRMGDSTQVQLFKSRIATIPGVVSNTLGEHLPKQKGFGRINTKYLLDDHEFYWNKFEVDSGFLKTYDLQLLAGRNFDRSIQRNAVLINQSALKALNVSAEEALGLHLREDSINYVFRESDGVVIGVVEDFAYKSVKEEIEPLVIVANNWVGGVLSVKLASGGLETIESLEKMWNEVYHGRPFEYWFLDKEFEIMYGQERRLGKLIPLFSSLAITIALLGLFALTAYVSELRRKEIGIRKVLGCSTGGVLKLLGWQYVRTLILAIFISVPIAYFALEYWLNNFSYRVEVSAGIILTSVFTVVFVSLLTVSIKSFSAAISNPVESLKYE